MSEATAEAKPKTVTHILRIQDTKARLEDFAALSAPTIRAYFVQRGFSVGTVATKASGHVFVTSPAPTSEISRAWSNFEPGAVAPVAALAVDLARLSEILPKLRAEEAPEWEEKEALAIIIELVLKSYGVPPFGAGQ